jgi:hypothetical protein
MTNVRRLQRQQEIKPLKNPAVFIKEISEKSYFNVILGSEVTKNLDSRDIEYNRILHFVQNDNRHPIIQVSRIYTIIVGVSHQKTFSAGTYAYILFELAHILQ